MGNDCQNSITITTKTPELMTKLYNENFKELIDNEKNLPDYAQGSISIIDKGPSGLIIKLWSSNQPNYTYLHNLIDNYECWLKNLWHEEGGEAGIFIGYKKEDGEKIIKEYKWDDLCIESNSHHFLYQSN